MIHQAKLWTTRSLSVTLCCLIVSLIPALARAQSHTGLEPKAATRVACPAFLPAQTQCVTGVSPAGAAFIMAKPENWNGRFILFAHGGPRLGLPKLDETIDDLEKFQVMVREGYGWAGTTYRRGGYGVRSAAADMDDLRQIVWNQFGRPQLTLLHGQSWGGNVAAKAAELYALDMQGKRNFDGVVLTSAVLAGGTRAYQLRADLRAVYQFYCQNHPASGEPSYPVWQGLPAGATMARAELARRVQSCTGVGLPPARRTPAQNENLRNITRVLSLEEDQILPNLAWGTNTFQDLVSRLDGKNPFSNVGSRYQGSSNDRALNAGVVRFATDEAAVAQLAYDSDLTGLIVAPTITLHGMNDPVARVCHQSAYRQTIEAAGRGSLLVQTFTSEAEHSRLSAPAYPAVFNALVDWIKTNTKPTPLAIKAQCEALSGRVGEPCQMIAPRPIPNWPC
jgi:pimeloyl-ACP methyl ester carboxylesterase